MSLRSSHQTAVAAPATQQQQSSTQLARAAVRARRSPGRQHQRHIVLRGPQLTPSAGEALVVLTMTEGVVTAAGAMAAGVVAAAGAMAAGVVAAAGAMAPGVAEESGLAGHCDLLAL